MLIIKEKNIKLINFDSLFNNIISNKIYSFINCNNLIININNIDCKKIFLDFIISELIDNFDINYKNIYIFANNINCILLSELFNNEDIIILLQNCLEYIAKYLNFLILFDQKFNFNENISQSKILELQLFLQKRNKNISPRKKIKMFCEKNGLNYVLNRLNSVEESFKFNII